MGGEGERTVGSGTEGSSRELTASCCAALGAATGLGALAASSCCVAPLAVSWLGLSAGALGLGILGAVDLLARWRAFILAACALLVLAGWTIWWRQRRSACASCASSKACRESRVTVTLLVFASVSLAGALAWE